MASKLTAARIAAWSGIRTVIASARRPGVLQDAYAGLDGVGTSVVARDTRLSARKLWIAFAMPAVATITVDDGARRALERGGTSLLAAGVVASSGEFDRRDPVELSGPDGTVFAKGVTRLTTKELDLVAGRRADEVDPEAPRLVVHADDLVVIG